MKPQITVLMAVYNGEKYLKEAMDSILSQTFADFEFLIINDGSTDTSAEIVRSYSNERINFVENEHNMGLSASLNRGIELAKGEYIARMDADDICRPERLEKQYAFMEKNPEIDVCGSWAKFFGELNFIAKYPKTHDKIVTNAFFSCPMAHPTVIFRKEPFIRYNLRFNPDFKVTQDYELWTRAFKHLKFANIQEVLLDYRVNPGQLTSLNTKLQQENHAVWKLHLENLGIDFTDGELALHCAFLSEKYSGDSTEPLISWLDKVFEVNRQKPAYNEKLLLKQLQNKYYVAYKNVPNCKWVDMLIKPANFRYLSPEGRFRSLYREFKKLVKREYGNR